MIRENPLLLTPMRACILAYCLAFLVGIASCSQRSLQAQPENTFNECLSDIEGCFSSNTTLVFSPGTYLINEPSDATALYTIKNVWNLSLKAHTPNGTKPTVTIICQTNASFIFLNVSDLSISGIAFLHCGAEISQATAQAVLEQTHSFFVLSASLRVALFFLNIKDLRIDGIHVNRTTGVGLMAINALGQSELMNSTFHDNSFMNASTCGYMDDCRGGGAVFVFTQEDYQYEPLLKPHYSFSVFNCTFTHGVNIPYHDLLFDTEPFNLTMGAGLSLVLAQSNYNLSVGVYKVVSRENAALYGANLLVLAYETVTNFSLLINNSTLSHANTFLLLPFLRATEGGGLQYVYGISPPKWFKPETEPAEKTVADIQITINQVIVSENLAFFGAGFSIWELHVGSMDVWCCHTITIVNCTFANNSAEFGSATYIWEGIAHLAESGKSPYLLQVYNSSFQENKGLRNEDSSTYMYPLHTYESAWSAVAIDGVMFVHFIDCTFKCNQAAGIYSAYSFINFYGTNSFYRNSGTNGGALSLYLDSILMLHPDSHLELFDNRAKHVGGGIYVSSIANFNLHPPCFYQVVQRSDSNEDISTKVSLRGNTAGVAGDAIYGGNLDNCLQVFIDPDSIEAFERVFETDVNLTNSSQTGIASNALGPCFCDNNVPKCSIETLKLKRFSGEAFNISVIGVGQFNGTVPSVIVSEIYTDGQYLVDPDHSVHNFPPHAARLRNKCSNLSYEVHAENNATVILLTDRTLNYKYLTKTVEISIEECPVGFELQGSPPTCNCEAKLHDYCNPESGTVTRSGTVWIGYFSNSTLYYKNCPNDYCLLDEISLTLADSDKQCTYGRTGILCGACTSGLSLTLGTSRCEECSNSYLAFICVFAVAGLLLVLLLFLCDLTVTAGTINGVIFYANIIRINHSLFFPGGKTTPLTIFIAWLNLDLGFTTCFYEDMDGYAKTWLQFAFPAYIWAMVFIIIISSKYSSLVQRICASNAVPVLATLFLLSYAKLQRTVITSLSCTWLYYNWGRSTVWLYDGNIQCFKGKHLILALVAFAVELLFILPGMLLLLFARLLQAKSTYHILRWVNKLKPLLDAYQGPYNDSYRHWLGLILFVQNVLFVAFALNIAHSPEVDFLVMVTVILLLLPWVWRSNGVYKSEFKNLLECFLHVNLGILAAASLYIRKGSNVPFRQTIASHVMIGLVFVAFLLILLFHIIQAARKIPVFDRVVQRCILIFKSICHTLGLRKNTAYNLPAFREGTVTTLPQDSYELVISARTRNSLGSSTSLTFLQEFREPLLEDQ